MYKLIAHRGNHSYYEENTIDALKKAINGNYAGFECDIRQTKDNKFALYHDALYNGELIRTKPLKELNGITLMEDILKIKTKKLKVLDIKDPFLNTNNFLNIISKYDNFNLYIMSFYPNVIKKLDILNRKYKIGIINIFINDYQKDKYDFICINYHLITNNLLKEYKKDYKDVFIYGDDKMKYDDDNKIYYITDENVNK